MSTSVAPGRPRPKPLEGSRWPRLLLLFPRPRQPVSVAFWPMWRDRRLLALGNEILPLALLATGILLLDEPDQLAPAAMLFGSSAL